MNNGKDGAVGIRPIKVRHVVGTAKGEGGEVLVEAVELVEKNPFSSVAHFQFRPAERQAFTSEELAKVDISTLVEFCREESRRQKIGENIPLLFHEDETRGWDFTVEKVPEGTVINGFTGHPRELAKEKDQRSFIF